MKKIGKIVLTAGIVLSMAGCFGNSETPVKKYTTLSIVESYDEENYDSSEKTKTTYYYRVSGKSVLYDRAETISDDSGKSIKVKNYTFYSNSPFKVEKEIEYFNDGNLKTERTYYNTGKDYNAGVNNIKAYIEYYDLKDQYGVQIRKIDYSKDASYSKIYEMRSTSDGAVTYNMEYTNTYNALKNILEIDEFDAKNSHSKIQVKKINYTYNSKNLIETIVETTKGAIDANLKGNVTSYYTYSYDGNDHVMVKTEYNVDPDTYGKLSTENRAKAKVSLTTWDYYNLITGKIKSIIKTDALNNEIENTVFDDEGRITLYKNATLGVEEKLTFDDKGKLITYINKTGLKERIRNYKYTTVTVEE